MRRIRVLTQKYILKYLLLYNKYMKNDFIITYFSVYLKMDLQLSSTHSIFKVRIYVAKRIYICIQFYVVDIVTFIFYYNIKRQQNCVVVCVHIKPKNHFHNNNPWLNSGEAITKLIRLLIVLFVFSCSSSTFLFLTFFVLVAVLLLSVSPSTNITKKPSNNCIQRTSTFSIHSSRRYLYLQIYIHSYIYINNLQTSLNIKQQTTVQFS